jgi:hypothetical protein
MTDRRPYETDEIVFERGCLSMYRAMLAAAPKPYEGER